MSSDNLRLIYSSILKGYSSFLLDKNFYYIKHLNALDSCDIDIKRQEYFDLAQSRGYISYQDKYNELIKKNLWSEIKERELKEFKDFLGNLYHSKKKSPLQKDKKLFDKDIETYKGRIFDLESEKDKLIGKTAEKFSDRRANEYYIFISLFKNETLTEKLYTKEQFKDLDQEELDKLVKVYNEKISIFNESNLKKISLLPGFFNLFCLSGDYIHGLFGKPFIELTFYQIELISWAKQFKNILQNSKTPPPNHLFNDPDRLIEWFNLNEGADKVIDKEINEAPDKKIIDAATSLTGASKEELRDLGANDHAQKKLQEELKKKGELGFQDLLRMGL